MDLVRETTTVARMIEISPNQISEKELDIKLKLHQQEKQPIALTIQNEAPSSESDLRKLEAVTLHKLLGAKPIVIENWPYDGRTKSGDIYH